MNKDNDCIIVIPTEYTSLNTIKVFNDNYTQTGDDDEEECDCGICMIFLWWCFVAFIIYLIMFGI